MTLKNPSANCFRKFKELHLTFQVVFTYRVTPQVMLAGLLFALVLGALGGVLPACGAARTAILVALREG